MKFIDIGGFEGLALCEMISLVPESV